MTLKFNSVNIVTETELENEYAKPYIEYLEEMKNTYIGYADGSKATSDSNFYKEIITALGGEFDDLDYESYNLNWFEDTLSELPWFENSSTDGNYQNLVLVVKNYEQMILPSPEKKYSKYYLECLKNAVNWWTNDIITYMVDGPNSRKNFTIILLKNE